MERPQFRARDTREMDNLLDGFEKYPALREHPIRSASTWIRGRAQDDGYGDLWRVYDKLYDLTDFIDRHPGGKQWIEVTRGTDITEAFETSHLNPTIYLKLNKYYVKNVDRPRNSPYTLEPHGFYMTLKGRVRSFLADKVTPEQKRVARQRVLDVQNRLIAGFIILLTCTALTKSYLAAMATGLLLFWNIECAHNFYHQRDNWRMHCWDLSFLSSYEWRITHSISHHIYTNTIWDFELSDFEPHADFRVCQKSWFRRHSPKVLFFITPAIFFFIEGLKRVFIVLSGHQKLRWEYFLPFAQLVYLCGLGCSFDEALKLWVVMHVVSSYLFGVLGLIAAHHHPDLYHAGDGAFQHGDDWGLAQLDAVRDRKDVNGILLAELTMYGNHVLHHLFPTMDHGLLDTIRPVFEETCRDFKVPPELYQLQSTYSQWNLFKGMFNQIARTEPRGIKAS